MGGRILGGFYFLLFAYLAFSVVSIINMKYLYTRSQTQSKQKALGETEAQRGAEACLRSHSQLEAQLGVEQRGEAGLFV